MGIFVIIMAGFFGAMFLLVCGSVVLILEKII